MNVKYERLNQTIKREITNIIQTDLDDPSIGFVTISDVVVSPDLSVAMVYVSFLGKEEKNKSGLKALNNAKGRIKTILSKKMSIRKVPNLVFKLDSTMQRVESLNRIFSEIETEKKSSK